MSKEVITGLFVVAAAVIAGFLGRGPIRFSGPLHVVVSPTNWFTSSEELVADERTANNEVGEGAQAIDAIGQRVTALETARARDARDDGTGARVAALETAARAPQPTHAPAITERDVAALSTRVASLQQTVAELRAVVEGKPEPEPMNIPTALAAEGLPLDAPIGLKTARASSTADNKDPDGKPLFDPVFAIDGNPETYWFSRQSDTTNAWIDISLDQYRKITGIRFLTHPNIILTFSQATIVFEGSVAQKLQLTERQRSMTGWFYFPLQSTDADSLRILFTAFQQPDMRLFDPKWSPYTKIAISEIEIYGH